MASGTRANAGMRSWPWLGVAVFLWANGSSALAQDRAIPGYKPPQQIESSRVRVGVGRTTAQPDFTVAVFGDAFAASVAHGLSDAFHDDRPSIVLDATNDAKGLTQDDVSAWSPAIDAVAARVRRIDAAVIMIGGADLRAIAGTDIHADLGSAGWRAAYGDRVEHLAELFRDRQIPLIWVGLPVVRDEEQASRFADLNAIFRDRAVRGGATFVDSWEAFVDDNGSYDASGPDVNGQPAKLRRNDGWGFTRSGARKLASFVESDLKPWQDRAESSRRLASVAIEDQKDFDQALQIDVNAQIRGEAGLPSMATPQAGSPAGEGQSPLPSVGPVLPLTAPPLAAGGRLATLDNAGRASGFADIAGAKGPAPPPKRGRTDDFSWPPP